MNQIAKLVHLIFVFNVIQAIIFMKIILVIYYVMKFMDNTI